MGEQATLSLKFDGVQPQNAPALPAVSGLQFQYVGPSSSFSFINGQTSSSITYNYIVLAQHDGEFTIPAMRTDVNGQQLASKPVKLTVSKASAPSAAVISSGNEVAFMRLLLPQKTVYVGQALTAQLEIFLRDDVQDNSQPQFTTIPADGFQVGKNAGGKGYRTQVANRTYTVFPIAIALTTTKTGTLTLGPFTASLVVLLPSQNQNGGPFAMLFNRGEQKQVTLATEKIEVQSLPLPVDGKPANFNEAVGNYTLAVTAGPTNVAVGDPITLRVQIAGQGNWAAIKSPIPTNWNDFKLFPPTSKLETSDQLGLDGTKTFEEIVTPQNADVRELPALAFSFFNPDDGKYHVLAQPATPLAVHSAGSTPLPTLVANKNSGENQTPQDILPIKETLGTLVRTRRSAHHPPRVSRRADAARAGVSRRVYLAEARRQPGEQSAPPPPARCGGVGCERLG